MMNDGDVDIRILALRRQQQKRKQSILHENNNHLSERQENNYSPRLTSGRSAYEATPVKAYSGITPISSRRSSFAGDFDEEARIGRMHVPPVIRCQCNGIETFALISTSETVSTISMDFVKKLRLLDQVQPDTSPVFNPLSLHQPELKGKVKYVDLAIGKAWQQVAQFNIVEDYLTDITLGIDFLRRTQSAVHFGDSVMVVGGSNKGERIPLLSSREVMSLARRNNKIRHTPLLIAESD